MVRKTVAFSSGLFKIFDEVLVNAMDHAQREAGVSRLEVTIDRVEGCITVLNDGPGIPVEFIRKEQCYAPELIFGHLLTSSNYDDSEERTVGGRNGYGAKLTNIYSSRFEVETQCNGKFYRQVWEDNMGVCEEPEIDEDDKEGSAEDYTSVKFFPDWSRFGMEELSDSMLSVMERRVYDTAGCLGKSIKVKLNGVWIQVPSFKEYAQMFMDEDAPEFVSTTVNGWEVIIAAAPSHGFSHVSFVNGIATSHGGTHVNYIEDQVTSHLVKLVKADHKTAVAPVVVRNCLFVFINCRVVNPEFGSQTKESMRSPIAKTTAKLPVKFLKEVASSQTPIMKMILASADQKASVALARKSGKKDETSYWYPGPG